MNRLNLPGAWSSTGNALRLLLFTPTTLYWSSTTLRPKAAALTSRDIMRPPIEFSAPPATMRAGADWIPRPSCGNRNRHAL